MAVFNDNHQQDVKSIGANGLLLKSSSPDKMIEAVEKVYSRNRYGFFVEEGTNAFTAMKLPLCHSLVRSDHYSAFLIAHSLFPASNLLTCSECTKVFTCFRCGWPCGLPKKISAFPAVP